MTAKPKKAASKRVASKATSKAAAPTSKKAGSSRKPESEPAAAANGVALARRRRLARAGLEVDRCPLLDIELDIGPRAGRWQYPTTREGGIVSALAAAILESGVSPDALELAAARLRERGDA